MSAKYKEKIELNKRLIIEYVRTTPLFYDYKLPEYSSTPKQRRIEILNEFGQTLDPPLTGEQVKAIWNNLRGTYVTKKKQYVARGIIKKKWVYYDSLSFLDDYIDFTAPDWKESDVATTQQQDETMDDDAYDESPIGSMLSPDAPYVEILEPNVLQFKNEKSPMSAAHFEHSQIDTANSSLNGEHRSKSILDEYFKTIHDLSVKLQSRSNDSSNDSSNVWFCKEISSMLDKIYDSTKAEHDISRFLKLEKLKLKIRQLVIDEIETLVD